MIIPVVLIGVANVIYDDVLVVFVKELLREVVTEEDVILKANALFPKQI